MPEYHMKRCFVCIVVCARRCASERASIHRAVCWRCEGIETILTNQSVRVSYNALEHHSGAGEGQSVTVTGYEYGYGVHVYDSLNVGRVGEVEDEKRGVRAKIILL